MQRDKEHIRAFQGLFNAAVAGAVAWAAFAAILAILWGVML